MTYLLDTDWLAEYLKGRAPATAEYPSLASGGLAVSLITFGEVYDGIYAGRDPRAAEDGFLRFLRVVTIVPLSQAIMKRFARLRGELRRRGQSIGDSDLMIAATALHHDLTLVTRNLSHFRRIPDLALYQPPVLPPGSLQREGGDTPE